MRPIQDVPANLFFGRKIKACVPIKHHKILVNYSENATPEVPSKYNINQDVWIKPDPNTKWVPGKIEQLLPNQSYEVVLRDGHIFWCNEHHITLKRQGAKWPYLPHVPQSLKLPQPVQPYNLRSRKNL